MGVFAGPEIVEDGLVLALDVANSKSYDSRPRGQQTYTSSGTYSWTCPSGVTSVSVVCVGGGGGGNGGGNGVGGAGGGGGGGLGYKNNISVTPGQSYTVVVGGGGAGDAWDGPPYSTNPADSGGDSYFIDATTVKGGGGGGGNGNSGAAGGSGGTYVGDGGGNGNSGGTGSGSGSGTGYLPATGGGGGSTGTYTGNATTRGTSKYITSNCTSGCLAGNGTGQGLLGDGSSGLYGRGGGANMNTFSNGTSGYTGAVRIMWGPDRSYPSTGVADQTGSTAFDDISGNSNTGTLTNGPTYSSDDGGSIVFYGTDDYITFPSSSSFGFGTGDFTVELFIRPDVVASGYIGLCGSLNVGTPVGFAFGTDNAGYITYSFNSSGATTFTANSTGVKWSANVWQQIVLRRESGSVIIFLNGSQIGTTKTDTANLGTSDDFVIGRYYTNYNNYYFDGKISNFKIYSKALTASEIQQNYNALRSRFGI